MKNHDTDTFCNLDIVCIFYRYYRGHMVREIKMKQDLWKETVRDIYDLMQIKYVWESETHECDRTVIDLIERHHKDYFTKGKKMKG